MKMEFATNKDNVRDIGSSVWNKWRWDLLDKILMEQYLRKTKSPGQAFCTICNKTLQYQSGGKKDLNRHMESNQAVKAVKSNYSLEGMLFGSKGSLSEETPTVVMNLPVLLNLVLVLLGLCIRSTYSLSVHSNKNIGNVFYESELLSAAMPLCNNRTGLSCPSSDFDRDNRILFCSFRCPQGKHYQCKEDADHGIIEFCAKPEICDKGQRNSVYFDEEHKSVVIKKDICPEGSYQPFEEDCYIACTQYHHVNESDLPYYGIAVLYHGNATNAGVGYCDVDRDYVNMDYNMYINLTQHELLVCDKKENYQIKCAMGQRLLPDSRCTTICEEGYEVDKENFFKCSVKSSIDTVIDKSSTLVPSISSSTLVPSISRISPSKHITTATQPSTTAQQNAAGMNNDLVIILSVVSCLLFVLLCGFIGWRTYDRKRYEKCAQYDFKAKKHNCPHFRYRDWKESGKRTSNRCLA